MKFENLTTKEKIISWFDMHKQTINDPSEDRQHILEWIYGGYRGKDTAKMDLCYELTKRGMNFNSISQDIFRTITFQFLKVSEQPHNSNLVLLNILKDKKLETLKEDLPNFNHILYESTVNTSEFNELKEHILYPNIPPFKKQIEKELQYTIAFQSHPIVFLLQYYIFKNANELRPLKHISKFQEYNKDLNLNNIPFNYLEKNYNCTLTLKHFNINEGDSITICLEKINNQLTTEKQPQFQNTIELTNKILKINNYRTLNTELPTNKQNRIKFKL